MAKIAETDDTTALLEAIEAQNRAVSKLEQRWIASKETQKERKDELDQGVFELRKLCGSRDETPLFNDEAEE